MQPELRYRIAPKARLVFDATRGEHMLIYPERGLALNGVGRAVLDLCDGRTSVAGMIEQLAARFAADAQVVERDVSAFLDQLAQRGVIIPEGGEE